MTVAQHGSRRALLIASQEYVDPAFQQLRAPAGDVAALAEVLADPTIGAFELRDPVINKPKDHVCEEIEDFFDTAKSRDLLLLYLSCHGVLSPDRSLYFAVTNTKFKRLRATGISESFLQEVVRHTRAQKVLLVLDCCHSGAYGEGMMGKGGPAPDLAHRFDGQGRATLTASTGLEYAFEGGEQAEASGAVGSVFTRVLVEGLRTGAADTDDDGHISLDELYDYVYAGVREVTPHQTPGLTSHLHGDIWVAMSAKAKVQLPTRVKAALTSDSTQRRLKALQELLLMAHGNDEALARAAAWAIEQLVEDDSRKVSKAAEVALASLPAAIRKRPSERGRDEPPPAEPPQIAQPQSLKPAPPAAGSDALTRGDEALRSHRLRQALGHYERALAQAPSSIEALTGCGWARLRLHELIHAQADFDRALALRPEHVPALVGRSRTLSARHRSREALRDAELAIQLDPRSPDAHAARGEALASTLRYDDIRESVAAFDAALRIDPDHLDALVGRCSSLTWTGDTPPAIADADRAISLDDLHAEAYVMRASARLDDDPEAAGRDLERALELDPGDAGVHLGFATLRMNQERMDEAAASADRALQLNPESMTAFVVRATLHLVAAEPEAAMDALRHAARVGTRAGLPMVLLGGVRIELGEFEAGLHDLTDGERKDPAVSKLLAEMDLLGLAHTWRGRAHAALERPAEAIAAFDEALAVDPKLVIALQHRADEHAGLDHWEASLADLTRAAEIEPSNEEVAETRKTVIRIMASDHPERLPPPLRREIEAQGRRNAELLAGAKFEGSFYAAQKKLLLEQLTGTERLLWVCRVARETEFFRSTALVLTTEKLLWCRESAVSNAEAGWVFWHGVEGVDDASGSGFTVRTKDGSTRQFTQIQHGTDLSGEGIDLSGAKLRDAVRALAGVS